MPHIFSRRVKLFSLFGFDVWIDASWILLAGLISWTLAEAVFPSVTPHLARATYWWMAIATTIGLMFSIVFHEMSHSLVARRYGLPIRGITLFIFGGVAEMEQEPSSPKAEFLMAVAGPIASFLLCAVLFALLRLVSAMSGPDAVKGTLWYLASLNGILALFNLVPAFPLDGGRMLRAALWHWRGDLISATRIAADGGDLFGVVLIVLGVVSILSGDLVGGVWRILIGMFLRGAATASYQEILTRNALDSQPVSRIMTQQPIAASPNVSITSFIEDFIYRHHHRTFPVTSQGRLIGMVGTEQIAAIDRTTWPLTPIAQIMVKPQADDVVAPDTDTLSALSQMRRTGRRRLWVVDQGQLVGILSLHDVLELLSTTLALKQTRLGRSTTSHQRGAP